MKYLYSGLIILLLSSCVHTMTDEEIKSSYNLPDNFRNTSYIDDLNSGKVTLAYKDPVAEIKSMLPDNSFISILDTASHENPDLLILLSKIKQARYQLKSATGAMIPQVSGSLDYSYGDSSDGLNGSLTLSWEADIYGKLDALRKSKKELIKYAEENYVNGQVTMAADTATYYFSIRKAAAQAFFANKMLENYKMILDIYTQMRSAGLVDESEYIETTMDYLNGQNNVQQYQLEVEQNKNALYALINNKDINITTDMVYDTAFAPAIPKINDIPAEVILNRLYKFTALESSFGFNMVALVGGRPQLLTLENILTEFLNHRIEVVTRRTRYKLMKAEERMHIVEGLRIAVQNIDEVVKIIKESKDTPTAKKALMDRFDLSEVQSQAILDMRLAKITGLEIDKLNEEYEQLKKDIEYYNSILNSKSKLMSVIREEIVDIKTRYGDERKTEIADSIDDIDYEDLIPNDEMVVTITHNGYIKRTLLNNFTAQKRGGKGKIGAANKSEDFVEEIIYTTNKSHLFIFTTKGKVHFLKVYQIPEQSRDSKGRHISNLLNLDENEKIASFLTLPEKDETKSIFFATKFGVVKRVKTIEFKSGRSGIIALNLKDNDEIVTTLLTGDNDKVFLATRDGKTIQFSVEDVRPMGRTATGVRGIMLERDDVVVSAEVVEEDSPLLAVTSLGYGKGTDKDEYRLQSRGGKGLKLMKLTSKTGLVVGVRQINPEEDDIMLITKNGKAIRIAASEVSVIGRNTQGTRLMNTSGDEIISFTVVPKDDSDNEEEMQGEDNGSNS